MGIMINEGGTLKKIGDNLHPGSVFLLDLMANTISELGFTSSHYSSGSGYNYMKYVNSFDIGFEATFALILSLVGGTYGGVSATTFIKEAHNHIHSFSCNSGSSDCGIFGHHTAELCLQGNSRPTASTGYCITVGFGGGAPHTFITSTGRDAYLAFELQGSKLDLYGQIHASSNVTWDDIKNGYFCYRTNNGGCLSAIFMVVAF